MFTDYSPGGWLLLAGPRLWLFADRASADPLLARCWPLVAGDAALDDVLGVIAHEGLRVVGSFAAVSWYDAAVRVIARGAVSVEATLDDGSVVELRAGHVATWLDREFETTVTAVVIRGDEAPDAARLPLSCGAALASTVRIGVDAATGGGAAPVEDRDTADAPAPPPEPGSLPQREPALQDEPVLQAEPVRQPEAEPARRSGRADIVDTEHRLRLMVQPGPRTPDSPVPSSQTAPEPAQPGCEMTPPTPRAPLPRATQHAPTPEPELRTAAHPVVDGLGETEGLIGVVSWLPHPAPEPSRPPSWAATQTGAEPVHTLVRPRPEAGARTVPAVVCGRAHLNPPGSLVCRDCGQAVPPEQQVRDVPRPVLGVLRPLAGGEPIVLERDVVLGRDPKGSFPPGGPNVIRVPSPRLEVSGTHLAVGLDGWTVTVEDLGSTNGTSVTDGATVRELRPRERVTIEPGAVVTLGGEVALRFEVSRG